MGPSLRSMTTKELLLSCHHELGRPQQGAFDFGIGKNADGVARGIGVAGGFFRGVFEGTVAVEDGEDIGVGDAIEGAIVEDDFNLAALGRSATLERVDDGHGGLAFTQVAGDGLAEHTLGGGQVEDIVDDLEGNAEIAAVLAEALFLGGGGASQDAAYSHADGKQTGGFAVDEIEVLLRRNQLAQFLHLEEFAFDQLLGQFDHHIQDAEIALLHGDLKGLHVEPIAGEDAHRVAPLRIGGGTAAADLGLVNNVVVDERGGVDDLDHRGQFYGAISLVAEKFRRKEQEGGTDALASAGTQVLAYLGDGGDIGHCVASELIFDRSNIVAQQVEDLFAVDGRRGTQFLTCSLRFLPPLVTPFTNWCGNS